MWPSVGLRMPASNLRRVVFPAPSGPTTPVIIPFRIDAFIFAKAGSLLSEKAFEIWVIVTAFSMMASLFYSERFIFTVTGWP